MRIVGQMEDIRGKLSALKIVHYVGCEAKRKIPRIFSCLIFHMFSLLMILSANNLVEIFLYVTDNRDSMLVC